MQAEIITIGDEILIGQIVDSNSAWMAKELNKNGISIAKIASISDQQSEIVAALQDSLERVPLVFITGGLGPTNDDITKKTLSDYYGMSLIQDDALYEKIKLRLEKYGIPMNRFNREQALIPDKARILLNNFGTAPCMWFEKDGKVAISMPGVPFEMKGIMINEVIPAIKAKYNSLSIFHKTIMVQGIGESVLAEMLSEWEANLPQSIKLAYLPSPGLVRLRLSTRGENKQILELEIEKQVAALQEIIPNNIFSLEDLPMELVVADLLMKKNCSVGAAESCTGGYIAHLFTSHAGSSDYFMGGVVSYSNEAKQNILHVKESDLLKHGAVSKAVVEQMAEGARQILNVDYAIATSGIAGPDGGSDEKPVGTIWIAVASEKGIVSEKLQLYKIRERNIRAASLKALNLLRIQLLK
ncbi:competence/damage-inducible protein A [Ancylomarina longa]|uniref:CinA-like protein n=1 Tax=Ancylomarina longa TaxID=2487017 RepID=A0A434AZM0_9BACT|nr:competence/damage-inducible protein A [Ancylomarina longa]RUT79897.1 competence/damage-inducible protein A [Ancylomarina longa]